MLGGMDTRHLTFHLPSTRRKDKKDFWQPVYSHLNAIFKVLAFLLTGFLPIICMSCTSLPHGQSESVIELRKRKGIGLPSAQSGNFFLCQYIQGLWYSVFLVDFLVKYWQTGSWNGALDVTWFDLHTARWKQFCSMEPVTAPLCIITHF